MNPAKLQAIAAAKGISKTRIIRARARYGSWERVAKYGFPDPIRKGNIRGIAKLLGVDTSKIIKPRVTAPKPVTRIRKRIPYSQWFHKETTYDVPLKHINLTRGSSSIDIDAWINYDTWDDFLFMLRDTLTSRIKGIIRRLKKQGYIKFSLKVHMDEEQIGGDELMNVDKYISTPFSKDTPEMLGILFATLHMVMREKLHNYSWHLDKFYVVGDKLKEK